MGEHRIVLDGSTENRDRDSKRQRFHCTGCDLVGQVEMRPARSMEAFMAAVRAAHEMTTPM